MASLIYNKGKTEILNGGIDLLNDDIYVALVTSSYTPDKDSDDYFGDVDNEVSGAGYVAKALANKSITQDDANDRAKFDADDAIWTTATFTARAAIIYKHTGAAATSTLIAYVDFGEDYSATAEDFTIEWDSDGILYLGD